MEAERKRCLVQSLIPRQGGFFYFNFRPPGHVRAPGNLIIAYHPPICQEENAKKIKKIIFPKHLTNRPIYGILLVSRGSPQDTKMGEMVHRVKKVQRKRKFPLTNHLICDIIQIQSGGKSPLSALVRRHEE